MSHIDLEKLDKLAAVWKIDWRLLLTYMCMGLSNRKIALRMYYEREEILDFQHHIRRVFDARSTTGVCVLAASHGIIKQPDAEAAICALINWDKLLVSQRIILELLALGFTVGDLAMMFDVDAPNRTQARKNISKRLEYIRQKLLVDTGGKEATRLAVLRWVWGTGARPDRIMPLEARILQALANGDRESAKWFGEQPADHRRNAYGERPVCLNNYGLERILQNCARRLETTPDKVIEAARTRGIIA